MSETGISRETMLASLRDIRLPAEAAGGAMADIAVAIGAGALAALLVVTVLRALSRDRSASPPPRLADRLAALDGLGEEARRVALLHILKERAPERLAALRGDLYRPGGLPTAAIEAEVARLV